MSAPELPDDPSDWPSDPFELLGVARGTSEPDIKRAYTRLIRRFKPEHHPDAFRRIREAYEACLTQGRWFTSPTQFVEPVVAPPRKVRPEPVELEPVWQHNDRLRSALALIHRKSDRLGLVREQAAAKASGVLDNPMAASILPDEQTGIIRRACGFDVLLDH